LQKTALSELPLEESLDLYYDLFQYDKKIEPKLDELDKRGFSPDYMYRETRRSVASAAGRTKIYTGIRFDVPSGSNPFTEILRMYTRLFPRLLKRALRASWSPRNTNKCACPT